MKRILLILVLIFTSLPCYAKKQNVPEVKLQNIFLTDTSEAEDYIEPESFTLKGYAEYMEDARTIYLKDDDDRFVLNLKVPQKITSATLSEQHRKINAEKPVSYSKFGAEEYSIIPKDGTSVISAGGFSAGTIMEQDIDYGELQNTATFFSKYNRGRFSLSTAYERTIGSTYNNYYDNLYIAPEIKLNKYMSIKEILTADVTRNRKKTELVLSVNPFANTKDDRLNFEFGASQTYDDTNSLIREKIRFNTKFKL